MFCKSNTAKLEKILDKHLEPNKYELLLTHAKSVYNEEVTRFETLDSKALRLFPIIPVWFGLMITLTQWLIPTYAEVVTVFGSHLHSALYYGLILLILLSSIGFLIVSTFNLFDVISIRKVEKVPMNEDVTELFHKNSLPDIQISLSKTYQNACKSYNEINNGKAKHLSKSFRYFGLAFALFIIFILIIGNFHLKIGV